MKRRYHRAIAGLVLLAGPALAAPRAHAGTPACAGNALVTLDGGAIVNVEWPERTDTGLKGHAIVNRTLRVDYALALRPDGSVSTAELSTATRSGSKPPRRHEVAPGAVFWSDQLPSTLEQVVLRARAGGAATASVPVVAASKFVPAAAQVDRIDANDWAVTLGPRHYDVFVDDHGCMLTATLAAYGLTIERREVAAADDPLEDPYAAPPGAPYTATDVRIPAAGHVLAGTLTRPKRRGRAPAVVMITGISKHERNEGNPPFTPFRDLADVLGRAEIAVLRVDDRGAGASTGDFDKMTSFDEADDVRAEVAWLRKQPGIDPKRVGLVGHSEGAFIALVVAAGDPTIAAVVSLAGSGVPGEQLDTWQTAEAVDHDPAIPPAARAAEIRKQLADRSDWSPRDLAFVAADPTDYAARVRSPTLLVQGGSDLHVPPRSAERLAAVIRAAGEREVTVRIIPHVSHTLCPDVIGSVQAWTWLPSWRLSKALLDTVTRWLAAELRA